MTQTKLKRNYDGTSYYTRYFADIFVYQHYIYIYILLIRRDSRCDGNRPAGCRSNEEGNKQCAAILESLQQESELAASLQQQAAFSVTK